MYRLTLLGAACAMGAAACYDPGDYVGTVAKHVLHVKSAIVDVGTSPDPLAPYNPDTAGVVVLSDSADACADITHGRLAARHSYLVIGLVKQGSDAIILSSYMAINPYTLTNGPKTTTSLDIQVNGASTGQLYLTNDSCESTLDPSANTATDGFVTMGSVSNGHSASGAYYLTMGTQGDDISGLFNAKWCNGLMPFVQQDPNFLFWQGNDTTPPGCH